MSIFIFVPIVLFLVITSSSSSSSSSSSAAAAAAAAEDAFNATDLDCRMRVLALQYARELQPWRPSMMIRHIHDALQLTDLCHVPFLETLPSSSGTPNDDDNDNNKNNTLPAVCRNCNCIFINPNSTVPFQDGSILAPVRTIDEALLLSRSLLENKNKRSTIIVFRQGIHTIQQTVTFDYRDSGLTMIGYPGEDVWLSGGLSLHDGATWMPCSRSSDKNKAKNIIVANLTELLLNKKLPKIASLFTTNHRLIRARYPNSNPETAQWGYASPDRLKYSIPVNDAAGGDIVLEWHRPPPGELPTFEYIDFSSRAHQSSNSNVIPIKNDSTMVGYNLYASGRGGVCADLWGTHADSYWCSNASAGGWAEVDQECAVTAQLQIPIAMTYNTSHPIGQRLQHKWSKGAAVGGYIYAWHSQSWAMHMFEIQRATSDGTFYFHKGGGRQGGRNWCRCDQCTYAGPWCGQHHGNPHDKRLISGTWLIENVLDELDVPGEFYFDFDSKLLYLHPNGTETLSAPIPPHDLRFALLETLMRFERAAHDIRLENLKFRDTAATFFGTWSAPSGGDWSLHRGGAIFMENVDRITIRDCVFRRLDGNAIFLSRKTENIKIQRNVFEWIGENAIATWGETMGWDATRRTQPQNTVVEYNIFRELGIYQKQSSAWAQSKAALNIVRYNIMFNMPRAAINFNDGMGGGDEVLHNLIFNTCRESGDPGPINTWDRQPFLTTLRNNATPSFAPLMRTIAHNFIFANYGASEGVDNDDGSSWYHIHHNVFYDSEGFKMDYGGHDSVYEDNLVISYPATYGQHCIEFGTFFPGHGHVVRRNKCIVPRGDSTVAFLEQCSSSTVTVRENSYFVPMNGSATYECGNIPGAILSLVDVQNMFDLELGSKIFSTPSLMQLYAGHESFYQCHGVLIPRTWKLQLLAHRLSNPPLFAHIVPQLFQNEEMSARSRATTMGTAHSHESLYFEHCHTTGSQCICQILHCRLLCSSSTTPKTCNTSGIIEKYSIHGVRTQSSKGNRTIIRQVIRRHEV